MNPFFAIPDQKNIQGFNIYSVLNLKEMPVTKSWTATQKCGDAGNRAE